MVSRIGREGEDKGRINKIVEGDGVRERENETLVAGEMIFVESVREERAGG